jgi:hypothetical protein
MELYLYSPISVFMAQFLIKHRDSFTSACKLLFVLLFYLIAVNISVLNTGIGALYHSPCTGCRKTVDFFLNVWSETILTFVW